MPVMGGITVAKRKGQDARGHRVPIGERVSQAIWIISAPAVHEACPG